ncbi:hypothetical protein STSP_49140 [Streptomyces jeddahensis]|uniref:Uncharacterized protein n=1 Tax=Streptomyces jeddahensis TaxID=1716141 RepID=A0A177HLH4_9ACTN|nr:hypothetical protein STSP_49140 [Streptomyces jeddahensis]
MTRPHGIPTGARPGLGLVTKDKAPAPHTPGLQWCPHGEPRQVGRSAETITGSTCLIQDFGKVIKPSPGESTVTGTTTRRGAFHEEVRR